MWSGALMALALVVPVPAQAGGKLEISNIRLAHHALGPLRESPRDLKILPGDQLYYVFDIGGLTADKEGRISFATFIEIIGKDENKKDKTLFKNEVGKILEAAVPGTKFRHSVNINLGIDIKPGPYRVVVEIEDLVGREAFGKFEREFTIIPMELGLVRQFFSYDNQGLAPAPAIGVLGQSIYVNGAVVGLKPDPANKDMHGVTVEMEIFDEQNKSITAKPWKSEFKNLDTAALPFAFPMPVQKPGVYKIVVKATDDATKKTVTFTTNYTAVDLK